MCAYCEKEKPLFTECNISKKGIKRKVILILDRRIVTRESLLGESGYIRTNISDYILDYCPKCKKLIDRPIDEQGVNICTNIANTKR